MHFMTLNDYGQMQLVHDCLKIPAGKDFERCAREYTTFNYSSTDPTFETHTEFWKGRKFEVLLVPFKKNKEAVWVKAEVHSWEEHNNGPGDRFLKWNLNAKFTPDDSTIGVGSLVTHPINQGGKEVTKCAAVVTKIYEDENDEGEKVIMCDLTKCNASISFSERWAVDGLKPFDGIMNFHVYKMNVQGGGILSYNRLEEEAFTMKWLDPELGTPDGRDGFKFWYFDPTQIKYDLTKLAKDDRVQQRRRDYLKKIEHCPTAMMGRGGLRTIILKESFERLKEGFTEEKADTEPFLKLLLCVPYMTYREIVGYYEVLYENDEIRHEKFGVSKADEGRLYDVFHSEEDWCLVFDALIKVGIYLHNDKDWQNTINKSFTFNIEEDFVNTSLININNAIGEWFERVEQFRAAIWCYTQNLTVCEDDYVATLKCNIALAHKMMGSFVEAHKNYEEAILLGGKFPTSKEDKESVLHNAEGLQYEAKFWFGTSDHLPSFTSGSAPLEANTKCQSCQAEGATKSCSACHIVCYCNIDCQKEHWKKVHKRTCVGKMRNK